MNARPARLLLGSCPDSWGVWFADDPRQTPWSRFLDELAAVGYQYLELGPYGYLPTDPARLRDEVSRRGLAVAGGTVAGHSGLHKPGDFDSILAATRQVASLTAALGAKHVIFVPVPGYRDDVTGEYLEPAELDADGWRTLCASADEIGRRISEEFGVRLQFHPHADSHVMTQPQVERFLADTDPRYVSLCLDTGHLAYGRADSVEIIRKFPARIGYVHIKQMDPGIVAKAEAEDLPFGQAVAMGASVEPPDGLPDIPSVLAALNEAVLQELDAELYTVVEQDMYPCDFGKPQPIAERTYQYLTGAGLGDAR
ncbi:MAG TPA: TIM barrel protein [Streptosporangiaceae bacterium]